MKETKKNNRSNKFGYTEEDIKGIKVTKNKKKNMKESYSSFAEFLFEKEEKFVASTMRWITIKDERDRNQHILIKKKDGTILGGMGGKHNGEKLGDVFKDIEADREEIKQEEKPRTSQLLTKSQDKNNVLDKTKLEKYITEFKKEAASSAEFHKEMSIKKMDISIDERIALSTYTGSAYSIMNRLLRDPEYYEKENPDSLTETAKKTYNAKIQFCSDALKRNKSTKSIVTYRGIKRELMEKLSGLDAGDIITDDGFVSTSTSKKIADNFAIKYQGGYVMTILIPKGSQAASVKSLSDYPKENEVLVNKKARFEVKGIDHDKQEMIVELLPHEDD